MRDYEELVKRLRSQARLERHYHTTGKTSDEAADAIEELQSYADLYKELTEKGRTVARKLIDAYPKWISVEERLPEKGGTYLVCYNHKLFPPDKPSITMMGFSHNLEDVDDYDFAGENRHGWYSYDSESGYFERDGVTHWMPLPEPPKEEK